MTFGGVILITKKLPRILQPFSGTGNLIHAVSQENALLLRQLYAVLYLFFYPACSSVCYPVSFRSADPFFIWLAVLGFLPGLQLRQTLLNGRQRLFRI